jgi:hypothetical protein
MRTMMEYTDRLDRIGWLKNKVVDLDTAICEGYVPDEDLPAVLGDIKHLLHWIVIYQDEIIEGGM